MVKSLFTLFLIVLCIGIIFGSYKFFSEPISVQANSKNGNPLDPQNLPLGDGRVSSQPKRDYVMSCQNRFQGGGAFRDGSWIHSDGTWDSTSKAVVDGDVAWDGKYEIKVENGKRKLIGNGLPTDHHTGIFPIQQSDDAFKYDRNPNSIRDTKIVFELSLIPQKALKPSCVPMGTVGVMKTGVAIFNALDGEGRDAVAHEIQDKCDGHPQREGHYHYHNMSKCVETGKSEKHSELFGYALDGFGIYGIYGENGKELTNGDLDDCHGHTHEILWDGKKANMYHYHATREYPYTVGCFMGTPIVSREMPNRRPPFPPPF
jgi:YHYH protein